MTAKAVDMSATVAKLREIRTRQGLVLKPSPFLAPTYVDEYGDVREVRIRNYQAQGIMNLLQMERMILGDDTGLGKTLQTLSVIGYVWLKEPGYVPIIVTTKSSLFQWAKEVEKFMRDMSAVVVDGEPHERHNAYSDFFYGHDPSRKRLLLLTYDHVMRDSEQSVIRDRDHVASKEDKRALAAARKARQAALVRRKAEADAWQARFPDGLGYDASEYVAKVLGGQQSDSLPPPPGWRPEDAVALASLLESRTAFQSADSEVNRLIQVVTPPKTVQGIPAYMTDLKRSHPGVQFMLVMDEMHKLKNHQSQFHQKCHAIASMCRRAVGMTATPVQNKLMEFFSLFRIIRPELFPKISHFMGDFCVTKLQSIGGGRQVPVVVGYKNLDRFVEMVEPYYLSRKKYDVAAELPALVSLEVECELSDVQEELYDLYEAGAVASDDEGEGGGAGLLKALTGVQQACNAPQLLTNEETGEPWEGPSGKIDKIHEILTESALGKKVIIFSRFERMISLIEKSLAGLKWCDADGAERTGVKCVRVTGRETDPKVRERAKNQFQDPRSGVNVVLITTAGSESINLQAAEHVVMVDLPWSWGVYVQLTGRAVRIGSHHTTVFAHHLLARKRDGSSTMDHDVLKALREKKKLADKVAGESLQGGLQLMSDESDVARDIMALMSARVKKGDKKTLLEEVNAKLASARKKSGARGHEQPKKRAAPAAKKKKVVDEVPVATYDISADDI